MPSSVPLHLSLLKPRGQAAAGKTSSAVPLASLAGQSEAAVWCVRHRWVSSPTSDTAPSRAAFQPLLAAATAAVPPQLRQRTPLFVWATAGMRLLSDEDQAALFDTLYAVTRNHTAFAVARADGFRTLSGRDEGIYGWLAANSLAGADLTAVTPYGSMPPTLGALDLGGGSAQVVSAAGADTRRAGPHGLASVAAEAYAESYLGAGAVAMGARVRAAAVMAVREEGAKEGIDPCGFGGRTEKVEGGRKGISLAGAGSFGDCTRAVRSALAALQGEGGGSFALPPAALSDDYLAMALYYHVAHFLAVTLPAASAPPFPQPTLRELAAAGEALCATPWAEIEAEFGKRDPNTPLVRLPGRCLDAALVVALLGGRAVAEPGPGDAAWARAVGFGFGPDDRRFTFAESVGGTEVEWTLGAAVATLQPLAAAAAAAARRLALLVALPVAATALALALYAAQARRAGRGREWGVWEGSAMEVGAVGGEEKRRG